MALLHLPYLQNLSSIVVHDGTPWNFECLDIPHNLRTSKTDREKWINDPTTEWNCWSTWEGLNENQRLTTKGLKSDGDDKEENPPMLCHGFVADYDFPHEDMAIASAFPTFAPFIPNYRCRSLSGNAHLLWLFEQPIKVGSFELAKLFLEVISERLKIFTALSNCDKPAFTTCAKYYTNGADWAVCHEQKISYETGIGWLMEAHKRVNYAEKGYNVPLPAVRDALLLKDDKFLAQWGDIDFTVGAQGPTWWIEGSTSPKSAILKESGMFTFSSHAPKEFYSWADLLGANFVKQYRDNLIGSAVKGLWFDGRQFWREIHRGDWKSFDKPDILHFLKVIRGLSDRVLKGEKFSEIDQAYEFIIDHQNIEGAAPFVFKPNGLLTINKKPFLNTHTGKAISPVAYATEWGHPDHFPTLSKFFGPPSTVDASPDAPRFFKGGALALDTFISWLAHYYKSAYELDLKSGHNIFIAGPVGVGKTMMNRAILGGLMNGFREAKEYLMGEDTFGAELFSVGHWVVDDATMSTSLTAHRRWSEMIKRMAANKTFRYHEKFRTPMQVEWQGRVVSTLNSDEESVRLLPDLDISMLDKVELYRTTDKATIEFPEESALKAIIERELPYFASFLLRWQTPEHCTLRRNGPGSNIDYRFGGIKPWHDPSLVQHANQSSRTAGFIEILADWKQDYFKIANEGPAKNGRITTWTGSAFQLRKQLCASPATQDALRGTDNSDIGRTLAQLKAKGYKLECEDIDDIRYWTIFEDKRSK